MGVLNADRVNAGIFSGDGSLLSNVTAVGTGLAIENSGSLVGTALTIDFNTGVDVQFSGGIATITAQAASWQGNQAGTYTLNSVGIGTTNPNSSVGVAITSTLAVGIVTAYKFYQNSLPVANQSEVIAYAVALG
tara:strand:- start:5385 stop:5786 length:402 start_codon:yes stop_codon:yes gene_type:complete